jgi:putative DNA primase/helicase
MTKNNAKKDVEKLRDAINKGRDNKEGPTTTEIAEQLIQSKIFRTFRDNESIYYYRDGVYVRNGETKIKEMVHELLGGTESSQFCGEVIGKVQRATYSDRSEFTEHSEHKIVLQNGILDLDKLELHGHIPEWLALTKFPVNFKKDAKCHRILKFISEVARPGDVPLLQEWAGYNLWIFGYPAQKAMLLVGDGGNGKSTMIGIIEYMVGKENRSAVSLHELEDNRFARHDLYGKAANLYPDLPDKDLKSTGIFKMLTGGDPIRAEDKNVKAFTYHNVAKLTFSCNAVPRVPEDSVAYFRRWLIVEFPRSFEGSTSEDKDLKEKLINDTEEMSGFLNWALEGLQRLRANGWRFSNGKTVESVREDYIVRSDPYRAFGMHCVFEDPNGQVKKDDLFQAYRDHCEIHKVTSRSRDAFFKNFKDQFRPGTLSDYRPNKDEDPERPRMFKGISLRERSKWCFPEEEIDAQNISTKDPPHNGGLNGLNGLKEVQGVQRVQRVAPHVAYPQIESETLASPSKSDVPNANTITEAQGKEFIETLLNKEFYVIPQESGLTFDKREFKIAVVQPHDPQKREELIEIMLSRGFKKANTGTLGPLFFKMQVRSDKHEK